MAVPESELSDAGKDFMQDYIKRLADDPDAKPPEVINIRLKLTPLWAFIGYAQSADTDAELPMAWRKKLIEHAKNAEKLLKEAFDV
jgi:hypothetical protein